MRWIRDLTLLILLTALCAGVLYYQRFRKDEEFLIQKATADTRRLEMEIKYRAATKNAELNIRGWPRTVDPMWFEKAAPENPLVSEDRPWVEIASAEEAGFQHPPVRMTIDDGTAAFWYNPYQGVVRARVPVMVSDQEATVLYNTVNESTIPSIFFAERPAESSVLSGGIASTDSDGQDQRIKAADETDKPGKREPTVVYVKRTRPAPVRGR